MEEIQRVVDKGPNVGHAASSLTAAGSSSASSLTAAGGSDRAAADQRTSAPVPTDLVSPSVKDCWYTSNDWRTQDPGFHAWLNKSDPPVAASDQQPHGSRPEKQFGIFGSIPPPVASSPKAAGDKSAGYSQKALCLEHANKTYDELVDEFEKFDPVPAARKYNFNMCKNTDPHWQAVYNKVN